MVTADDLCLDLISLPIVPHVVQVQKCVRFTKSCHSGRKFNHYNYTMCNLNPKNVLDVQHLVCLFSVKPDGSLVAECDNPAVPMSYLHDIWMWMGEGATMEQVIDRLRPCTVPPGYTCNTWTPGWSYCMWVLT